MSFTHLFQGKGRHAAGIHNLLLAFLLGFASWVLAPTAKAQTTRNLYPAEQKKQLERLSRQMEGEYHENQKRALRMAEEKGWPLRKSLSTGQAMFLYGVDNLQQPIYLVTDNVDAAIGVGTTAVQPGGTGNLALTGATMPMGGLGIWEVGSSFRLNHQEFGTRISQRDGGVFSEANRETNHAAHVAGTMVASGVNPIAKGMAPAARLYSYNAANDQAEMAQAAANNMLVSNHSYAIAVGWNFNNYDDERWVWHGNTQISQEEDFNFGFYSQAAREWDQIAYEAPFYLIVKSAGNDRSNAGPAAGEEYWVFTSSGDTTLSTVTRPRDGGENGYDCITPRGVAKNILTIGAVNPLPNGYQEPDQLTMTGFSGWGPTDDGRIKPDLVAPGVNLLSASSVNASSYSLSSGTSMATPTVSASLYLLQEHHNQRHNSFMRAATLKALAIHTAEEAGNAPGPDYSFGWGLLNTKKAAEVISNSNKNALMHQGELENTGVFETTVFATSAEALKVTLAWTDLPGEALAPSLNPRDLKLVNDLDVRVFRDGNLVAQPYLLDPANPSAPATTGDNIRDNVEQIVLLNPQPGEYTIRVSHKGTLRGSSGQTFSLIVTGITFFEADLAALDAFAIKPSCDFDQETPILLQVVNNGKSVLTDINLRYEVVAENDDLILEGTANIPILGVGQLGSFEVVADLSGFSRYQVKLFTNHPDDQNPDNDQGVFQLNSIRVAVSQEPYSNAVNTSGELIGWSTENANDDVDESGTGHTWNFIIDGPNARSGRGYFSYYGTNTTQQANDWIFSRCFFLEADSTYRLGFWHRQRDEDTAQQMEVFLGQDPSPEGMQTSILALSEMTNTAYELEQVFFSVPASGTYYLGFQAQSQANQGNLYLDDFTLALAPEIDLAIANLQPQAAGCAFDALTPVTVTVANQGLAVARNVPVILAATNENGMTTSTEAVLDEVLPGTAAELTLIIDLSTGTNFFFEAVHRALGDNFPENDAFSRSVQARYAISSGPYQELFESREALAGWTFEDSNADGETFSFVIPGNPSFAFSGTGFAAAQPAIDEWLFTTCLDLEAGEFYHLEFQAWATQPVNLELFVGTSPSALQMESRLVRFENFSSESYRFRATTFSVPESGTYYIGFNVKVAGNTAGAFILDDFLLGTVDAVSIEDPIDTDTGTFEIYPNPVSHQLSLKMENAYRGAIYLRLYDTTGSLLFSEQVDKPTTSWGQVLNMEAFPAGLYLLELSGNKQRWTKKVLKE